MELRKKQQELKALGQQNLLSLKRLHKLAKDEMSRQELRRKINAADTEVSHGVAQFYTSLSKMIM